MSARILPAVLSAIFVGMACGCADLFRSPYDSFVAGMDARMSMGYTIDDLKVRDGGGIAAAEYFVGREEGLRGHMLYHYARLNIWGTHCYYHFVVEPQSKLIVGWGFDIDKADPRKTCGGSG